ncbi:MAG: flagellin lysine-N-methylase [Fibrobacter sp.]|nr:flagellin lysine-N-methylase [Fibrobacter sp.]
MLLRVPDFYSDFHCIADKCTDTCCVGWEIDVDDRSLAKYSNWAKKSSSENLESEGSKNRALFLQKLLKNIEDGHFKLLPGDRCPFLKKDGLCEMICNLGCNGTDCDESGETILCDICREHPRFVEVYGDIMEKGLGLCCEEAVRLLLTSQAAEVSSRTCSGISLVESEVDDDSDEMPEGAEEARDAIFEERNAIFGILNNKSIPLNERLIEVLDFAVAVSDCEDPTQSLCEEHSGENQLSPDAVHQTWIEILGEGESYGPAWDTAYKQMIRNGWPSPESCRTGFDTSLFTEEDGARIVAYLIFRYYAKSLFDGDNLTKVQFAIYFWIMVQKFGNILGNINPDGRIIEPPANPQTVKINAVKLLSKQTEYSEEIMEILADNFFQNPAFCVEQFRQILSTMQSSTSISP